MTDPNRRQKPKLLPWILSKSIMLHPINITKNINGFFFHSNDWWCHTLDSLGCRWLLLLFFLHCSVPPTILNVSSWSGRDGDRNPPPPPLLLVDARELKSRNTSSTIALAVNKRETLQPSGTRLGSTDIATSQGTAQNTSVVASFRLRHDLYNGYLRKIHQMSVVMSYREWIEDYSDDESY